MWPCCQGALGLPVGDLGGAGLEAPQPGQQKRAASPEGDDAFSALTSGYAVSLVLCLANAMWRSADAAPSTITGRTATNATSHDGAAASGADSTW